MVCCIHKKQIMTATILMLIYQLLLVGCGKSDVAETEVNDNLPIHAEAESSMILEDQDFIYIYNGYKIIRYDKENKYSIDLWKNEHTETIRPEAKALLIEDKIYFIEEWWSINSCTIEKALSVIDTSGKKYERIEEVNGVDLYFLNGILYVPTDGSVIEYVLYADGTWKKNETVTEDDAYKSLMENHEETLESQYFLESDDDFAGLRFGIDNGSDRVMAVHNNYIYHVGAIDYKLYMMRRNLDDLSKEEVLGDAFYDSRISKVGSVESCHVENYSEEIPDTLLTSVDLERLVVDEKFPGAEEINRALKEKQEAVILYEEQNVEEVEETLKKVNDPDFILHYAYDSLLSPVYYFDNHYFSFYQQDDDYLGQGAHGILHREGYTFDLQTGKRLALKDIIANSEEELRDIVAKYFSAYIDENSDIFWDDAMDIVKEGINLDTGFYLREDGICFYFPPYALAPFAAGFPEVTVPFEEFEIIIPLGVLKYEAVPISEVDYDAFQKWESLKSYFPVLREGVSFGWTDFGIETALDSDGKIIENGEERAAFYRYTPSEITDLKEIEEMYETDGIETTNIIEIFLCDLDEDGIQELILELTPVHDFLILHKENGKFYGFYIMCRGFENLQTNGIYVSSGGAAYNTWKKIRFENGYWVEEILAEMDGHELYLKDQRVDDDTFFTQIESYEIRDVVGYPPKSSSDLILSIENSQLWNAPNEVEVFCDNQQIYKITREVKILHRIISWNIQR